MYAIYLTYFIFIYAEIVREGSKSHAIYIVCVMRKDASGQEELWHVFRRYSEFHDFHLSITSKVSNFEWQLYFLIIFNSSLSDSFIQVVWWLIIKTKGIVIVRRQSTFFRLTFIKGLFDSHFYNLPKGKFCGMAYLFYY